MKIYFKSQDNYRRSSFSKDTYHSNMLVSSTKICEFAQKDLEPNTADVFGPNRGSGFSVPRVAMNWSNEDFRNSAENL